MAYRKRLYLLIPLFTVLVTLVLTSCEKFSGDQQIPAYLSIDSIAFTTEYSTQGTASHSISDAWVYVDGQILGTFQLPARFPVLQQGTHTVTIIAGIKKDGIASTRIEYPFYDIIERSVKLVPDSTTKITKLTTTYKSGATFLWLEDFDNVGSSLDTTLRSTVKLKYSRTGSDSTFQGPHSAQVELTSDTSYFEALTHHSYYISATTPTFLELNFNTNNMLTVGIYLYSSTALYEVPIMTLFPTDNKWKKIYIDLSTSLNAYSGMSTFRVYFSATKDASVDKGVILLDNCKLLTK